jgi:hypothetical protein
LFEVAQSSPDEELSAILLDTCAHLSEPARMKSFEPFIQTLITMTTGNQLRLAAAAANVCLTLAKHRPIAIMNSQDSFRQIAQAKRGEVSSICTLVVNQLSNG